MAIESHNICAQACWDICFPFLILGQSQIRESAYVIYPTKKNYIKTIPSFKYTHPRIHACAQKEIKTAPDINDMDCIYCIMKNVISTLYADIILTTESSWLHLFFACNLWLSKMFHRHFNGFRRILSHGWTCHINQQDTSKNCKAMIKCSWQIAYHMS